jgi:CBS domain containing-hemolysin-like protein
MLKQMPDDEDPHSRAKTTILPLSVPETSPRGKNATMSWFKNLLRGKATNSNQQLQEAIEEYIEDLKEADEDASVVESQKTFITNVIKTHDLRVADVMVPRAEIAAIDQDASPEDLKNLFENHQFSRIPVYRGSLDHITGIIHIKDILIRMLRGTPYTLTELIREAMIVSPGLPVMDLFLMMRDEKRHMALVVDEHGGIDGLVTINDVIEAIMGDLEDEFDNDEQPKIIEKPDGSLLVDARMDVEEFEERYGNFLSVEEREEIDTLGGLAIFIAGRVPKRGESLKHTSGMILEVADADTRRVNRLRLHNLPSMVANDEV